jgi:phage terminase large subunit
MPLPFDFEFDFKNPDYTAVYQWRFERLQRIRENPELLSVVKEYYRTHTAAFISTWGMTFDPRNPERGLPTSIPFILFPKQEEWISWLDDRWQNQERGITEKTRDMGISWVALAYSCTKCLFNEELVFGFGSRKEIYVDKIGDPKSLFWKARYFMAGLPVEFRGGWQEGKHAPHMRIIFPESGSYITGEAGDGIGRGDRTSVYFVDEAAHIERPQSNEASLSNTTNCRQDISSVNGMANPFAILRHSGKVKVFTYDWRSDPRKDDAWYNKMKDTVDSVSFAQEIDIDYQASKDGVVIPSAWINAAIDAHKTLDIEINGTPYGALDIADQGIDLCAFGTRKGILLNFMKSWHGKGSDTFYTSERAFMLADENGCPQFCFDSDGIGAFMRGDGRVINERRIAAGQKELLLKSFRGSASVVDPDREWVKGSGRLNKDYFGNYKAQSWWSLRGRFQETFRAVEGVALKASGKGELYKYDPEKIISIDGDLPELSTLKIELAQPTYSFPNGKIIIDKAPDNTKSPNLADTVMMLYAPEKKRMVGIFDI